MAALLFHFLAEFQEVRLQVPACDAAGRTAAPRAADRAAATGDPAAARTAAAVLLRFLRILLRSTGRPGQVLKRDVEIVSP